MYQFSGPTHPPEHVVSLSIWMGQALGFITGFLVPIQNDTGQPSGRFHVLSEPSNHIPPFIYLGADASAMQTISSHPQGGAGTPQTPHPQGGWEEGDAAAEGGGPWVWGLGALAPQVGAGL